MSTLSYRLPIVLLCCFIGLSAAMPLWADDAISPRIVKLESLNDPYKTLDLTAARTSNAWQTVTGEIFAGGYGNGAHWLRLTLEAPQKKSFLLTALLPSLDDVRLYMPAHLRDPKAHVTPIPAGVDDWYIWQQGDLFPFSQREIDWRGFSFALWAPNNARHTVYLRIVSSGSHFVAPQVWGLLEFNDYRVRESLVFGIAAGIFLVLFIVATVFWWLTGEALQGCYMALALTGGFYLANSLGLMGQFVLSETPYLGSNMIGFSVSLIQITTIAFLREILALRQFAPTMYRILGWTMLPGFTGVVLALLGWYGAIAKIIVFMALMFMLISCATALWVWLAHRRRLAGYNFLVYLLLPIGYFFPLSGFLGYTSPNVLAMYGVHISTLINVTLLLVTISIHTYQAIQRHDQAATAAIAEQQAAAKQRDWLAILTHEVKTPLAIIDASCQNMQMAGALPVIQPRLDKIRRCTRRIDNIVKSFLHDDELLSRLHPLQTKPLSLSTWLPEWVMQFDAITQKRLHLSVQPGLLLAADSHLLTLALNNLIHNALKYSPALSPINITAISLKQHSKAGALLSIQNEGNAISPSKQADLFKRNYSRLDGNGSHVGLWACREIILAHKGNIGFETGTSEGNLFKVWLPLRQAL